LSVQLGRRIVIALAVAIAIAVIGARCDDTATAAGREPGTGNGQPGTATADRSGDRRAAGSLMGFAEQTPLSHGNGEMTGIDQVGAGLTAEQLERRRKCRLLWATHAPWYYTQDLADFLCGEHEQRGIGPEWYYSLIYGMANFGLRVGATAPGRCYGPMDVKWPYCSRADAQRLLDGRAWRQSILRDPYVNIACHTGEMSRLHSRTGRTGMALIRSVFYPAAPWGRATNRWAPRWQRWDRKFRATLAADSERRTGETARAMNDTATTGTDDGGDEQ